MLFFMEKGAQFMLLKSRVQLNLVQSGYNTCFPGKPFKIRDAEVADDDGSGPRPPSSDGSWLSSFPYRDRALVQASE